MVMAIANLGVNVTVCGDLWNRVPPHQCITSHPYIGLDEKAEMLSRTKIALGYNTNEVYLYTSWCRGFDAMGCRAMYLTHYFPGLETVFEAKYHLDWFEDIPEAARLVQCYLRNDDERKEIAMNGHEEVNMKHTWSHRIDKLITSIKETGEATVYP